MNPYKILEIDRNASKREIIQAAAAALRKRRFSGREVALAQKTLLDPISGKAHEFLQFIDIRPILEQLDVNRPKNNRDSSCLEYLTVFERNT